MKPTVAVLELITDFIVLSLKLSASSGSIVQMEDVP